MRWLGAALISLLVACSQPQPEAADPGAPRLVSLAPAITETVATLGGTELLVGRSDWCVQPPEVTGVPSMGSSLTPDLERIAGARPSLILLDASTANRTDDLSALAPTEVLPWLTVQEVVSSTRRVGEIVGHPDEGEALARRLSALDLAATAEAPQVLLVIGGQGLSSGEVWFVARNSLHGAALRAAGGRNAVGEDVGGASTLSLEALVKLDPPMVVVLTPQEPTPEVRQAILDDWSRLETLAAVRESRVGVVGGVMAQSTGPGILELVQALKSELARLGAQ